MFKQLLKKSKSNFLILSPCIHLGVDLGPKTGAFFFCLVFFSIYSFDLIQPREVISVRNKLYMEKVKGNLYLMDINWKTAPLKRYQNV